MNGVFFSLEGSLGHFRKFYTTSSALTYVFPPPTAVKGLIGAILGIKRSELIEKTKDIKVGIVLKSSPKKVVFNVNFVNTKGGLPMNGIKERTQIVQEVLKEPKYRIYVAGEDEIFNTLKDYLKKQTFYYTPYLGNAEFIASFEFEGESSFDHKGMADTCHSVIPLSNIHRIDNKVEVKIGKDRFPILRKNDNSVEYEDLVYTMNAAPMKGKFKDVYYINKSKEFVYLFK